MPKPKVSKAAAQVPSDTTDATTADELRRRRKSLVSARNKRMSTLWGKVHEYGKVCQARVFLCIQHDDDETKIIYHSHPDEDWPKLSWSGIKTYDYPPPTLRTAADIEALYVEIDADDGDDGDKNERHTGVEPLDKMSASTMQTQTQKDLGAAPPTPVNVPPPPIPSMEQACPENEDTHARENLTVQELPGQRDLDYSQWGQGYTTPPPPNPTVPQACPNNEDTRARGNPTIQELPGQQDLASSEWGQKHAATYQSVYTTVGTGVVTDSSTVATTTTNSMHSRWHASQDPARPTVFKSNSGPHLPVPIDNENPLTPPPSRGRQASYDTRRFALTVEQTEGDCKAERPSNAGSKRSGPPITSGVAKARMTPETMRRGRGISRRGGCGRCRKVDEQG